MKRILQKVFSMISSKHKRNNHFLAKPVILFLITVGLVIKVAMVYAVLCIGYFFLFTVKRLNRQGLVNK